MNKGRAGAKWKSGARALRAEGRARQGRGAEAEPGRLQAGVREGWLGKSRT